MSYDIQDHIAGRRRDLQFTFEDDFLWGLWDSGGLSESIWKVFDSGTLAIILASYCDAVFSRSWEVERDIMAGDMKMLKHFPLWKLNEDTLEQSG